MRRILSNQNFIFMLVFLVGAGVTWFCGVYSAFHVSNNDFWTLVFYGRHMTWENWGSLYNGFYPVGYAFLVGQFPYTYVIQLSYLLNALLSGLFVASVSMLVGAKRFMPATLLAFLISLSHPLVYQYSNTPGPDMGTAAFPAFSIYLLWKNALSDGDDSISNWCAFLIGLSLGMGFLWRTHVIVIALLILVLSILFRRIRSGSSIALMTAAFLGLVSIQIAVDLLSGHRPFETAQMFNIYKLLYGLNWTQTPSPDEIAGFSIWSTIWKDPGFVVSTAFPYYRYLVSFAWPGLLCFFLSPKGTLREFSLFSLLAIVIYSIPLSISDSPRAPLAVMALYLSLIALIFAALVERIRYFLPRLKPPLVWGTCIILIFCALPIYRWTALDWTFIAENRMTHRVFVGIEQVLASHGMTSPDQVFSIKVQYYIPGLPPYTTRQFSTWSNDWVWGYREEYPPLSNESWEMFKQTCLEQEVEFLVISPPPADQGGFFTVIYEDKFDDDVMGLEFIAARANMRIYQFK